MYVGVLVGYVNDLYCSTFFLRFFFQLIDVRKTILSLKQKYIPVQKIPISSYILFCLFINQSMIVNVITSGGFRGGVRGVRPPPP
jgi:hypothetical protein